MKDRKGSLGNVYDWRSLIKALKWLTDIVHWYRKFICWKIASKSVRSRHSHSSSTERYGQTWICRMQIKPNWARNTRTTIQKFLQWLRKGPKTGLASEIGIFSEFQRCKGRFWVTCHAPAWKEVYLSHGLNCCSYAKYLSWSLSLIMAKQKNLFHEFSF